MAEPRMMCLTVKQPWALMIASPLTGKTVENRTWETSYRGLLAIHAGAYSGWDRDAESSPVALEAWKRWAGTDAAGEARTPLTRGEAYSFFKFGAVIAVADLTGCHFWLDGADRQALCSPWAMPGQYHWTLANVRPLAEPVRVRGRLGLWRLPEDAEKAVREQLETCQECAGTGSIEVDRCTCGAGPGSYAGMHERYCGLEPCPAGCEFKAPALTL